MNRSFNKIRHIQEANEILEKRILSDKKNRTGLYEQVQVKPQEKKVVSKLEDLIGMTIRLLPKEILNLSTSDGSVYNINTKDNEQLPDNVKQNLMSHVINGKITKIHNPSGSTMRGKGVVFISVDGFDNTTIIYECDMGTFNVVINGVEVSRDPSISDKKVSMIYTCPGAANILNQLQPCGGYDLSSSGVDLSSISTLS